MSKLQSFMDQVDEEYGTGKTGNTNGSNGKRSEIPTEGGLSGFMQYVDQTYSEKRRDYSSDYQKFDQYLNEYKNFYDSWASRHDKMTWGSYSDDDAAFRTRYEQIPISTIGHTTV